MSSLFIQILMCLDNQPRETLPDIKAISWVFYQSSIIIPINVILSTSYIGAPSFAILSLNKLRFGRINLKQCANINLRHCHHVGYIPEETAIDFVW